MRDPVTSVIRRLGWRLLGLDDFRTREVAEVQVKAVRTHAEVVDAQSEVTLAHMRATLPSGGWKPLIACGLLLLLSVGGIWGSSDALAAFDDFSSQAADLRGEASDIETAALDSTLVHGVFVLQTMESTALINEEIFDLSLRVEEAEGDEDELVRILDELQRADAHRSELAQALQTLREAADDGYGQQRTEEDLRLARRLRLRAADLENGVGNGRVQAAAVLAVCSAVLGAVLGWMIPLTLSRWPERSGRRWSAPRRLADGLSRRRKSRQP